MTSICSYRVGQIVAISVALYVSASGAAVRAADQIHQAPPTDKSLTHLERSTPAFVAPPTSLYTGANPRGIAILARRSRQPPRDLTTGNNPRGMAIVTGQQLTTPAETVLYQQILRQSGPSGLMYALSTGDYPSSGATKPHGERAEH